MEEFEIFVVTTSEGHFVFFAKPAAYRRYNSECKKGNKARIDRCVVASVEEVE